jgi:hypothetical protein
MFEHDDGHWYDGIIIFAIGLFPIAIAVTLPFLCKILSERYW